jgi:hypothetical protein
MMMIGITLKVTSTGSDSIQETAFFFDGTLKEAVEYVQAWKERRSYFSYINIEWSRPVVLPGDIREFAELFELRDLRETFA